MFYNIGMAKRFSKKTKRKTTFRLSPKDAEKIIQAEFIDSRGNKTYIDFNVAPHNPFTTPTIQWYRNYTDNGE